MYAISSAIAVNIQALPAEYKQEIEETLDLESRRDMGIPYCPNAVPIVDIVALEVLLDFVGEQSL